MSAERTRGLGRGLSALLSETETAAGTANDGPGVKTVPIDHIRANPDQPRRRFEEADLASLAESIAEKGVLQPLLVRPAPDGQGYEIVAGERRWRAAQRARVHDIPVIVRDLSDREAIEIAIVENVQRADLNPVEEARAFKQLTERFGHTQEEIARAVSKSRSHVANALRLLALPESVLDHLETGRLSSGHARAIASAPDPAGLADLIVEKGMSVRAAEQLARDAASGKAPERKGRASSPEKDIDTQALEADLAGRLGLGIDIRHGKGPKKEAGEIRISYSTLEQLDDLCRRLSSK